MGGYRPGGRAYTLREEDQYLASREKSICLRARKSHENV
jgi:hypothetical protein